MSTPSASDGRPKGTPYRSADGARQGAASPAAPSARTGPLPRAATTGAPVLRVDNLCKRYGNGLGVLQQVGFAMQTGEVTAVIGPNGSGKSTLLRCLVHLAAPNDGSVTLFGARVADLRGTALRALRARVGFVFQQHNLVPRLSVLSNVIHGAMAREGVRAWTHGAARRAVREEAMATLQTVGLADLAGRRADRLSGGQSQRVAIARALMQRPDLVLADEPVASLDPSAGEEVMELFSTVMRARRVTVLFTTHHIDHAYRHADRVIALKAGRILFDRPCETFDPRALDGLYDRAHAMPADEALAGGGVV